MLFFFLILFYIGTSYFLFLKISHCQNFEDSALCIADNILDIVLWSIPSGIVLHKVCKNLHQMIALLQMLCSLTPYFYSSIHMFGLALIFGSCVYQSMTWIQGYLDGFTSKENECCKSIGV